MLLLEVLRLFAVTLVVYHGFALSLLLLRFIRMQFDRQVKPDASKAILITGATSGFGLVIAKYLHKLGFTIVACYYNDQEPGFRELSDLSEVRQSSSEGFIFLVKMDVRSEDSIAESGKEVQSKLKENDIKLYALINNAGIARAGPFEWSDRRSINDVIDTNFRGLLMVTRQFLNQLIKAKGKVINISSGLYMFPGKTTSVYGSTKSAVAFFSDALNADLEQYGASCHCIMPGNFITVSNIIYTRYKSLQDSIELLSQDELATCKRSVDWYSKWTTSQVRAKLRSSGDDINQIANIYGFKVTEELRSSLSSRRRSQQASRWRQLLLWITGVLSGHGDSLELASVLGTFEQAICMAKPPRRLFAGGPFYTYIAGPMIDYYPRAFYDAITDMVMNHLT